MVVYLELRDSVTLVIIKLGLQVHEVGVVTPHLVHFNFQLVHHFLGIQNSLLIEHVQIQFEILIIHP